MRPKPANLSGFLQTARQSQIPPRELHRLRTWLFIGGRGSGKTRAGAEWLRYAMLFGGYRRAALVAPTLGDAREVMVEGVSGLISIEGEPKLRPVLNASRRRLEWPNGALAYLFSAEDPDSLRGPQFDIAWCDELAAWQKGEACWDMLQMGLRLGQAPKCMATTTPRPSGLIKRLISDPHTVRTHSRTSDNADFLAPGFLEAVNQQYAGSVLGRQELEGELMDDPVGALWTRHLLDHSRLIEAPHLFEEIIVAVDPPVTSGQSADACGIIVAGSAENECGELCAYILADKSERGLPPAEWASCVVTAATEFPASRIVAEANQGGELIKSVLDTAGCRIPIQLVHARIGKRGRASPVSALYAQGRVHHLGVFAELEDEMCSFGAPGFKGSPDRLDALVWAVHALVLDRAVKPRVRSI